MTDREIIQGLIDRDNHVTRQFFYVKCRPLLTAIMRLVFLLAFIFGFKYVRRYVRYLTNYMLKLDGVDAGSSI